ncbi:MAG: zinc metallopeptidase [Clostridia bacterium]|nr:zinc metallopeptidase [Clostridia bacterium]MBR6794714.1 zinc metallopeptidase [Clostridia bacterium]
MFWIDPYYLLLVLPAIILSIWASARVNSTFKRYADQYARSGLTGADAARRILDRNGLRYVRVMQTQGHLTDHYNPKDQTVYLSQSVYSSCSCSAIGVAAHEAGHAVQHAENYVPIKIRSAIIPATNFGAKLSMPLILFGILLSYWVPDRPEMILLAYAGVLLFSLTALFQLVTLPTEYNASARALKALDASGTLTREELAKAKKVLSAAALTYVAALLVSLMQLLRLLLMVSRNDRRR